MTSSALRPRSVTEIVDAAFQILKAHYPQFVMCSAIAYLPWLLLELLLLGEARMQAMDPATAFGSGTLLLGVGAGIGIWITYALMTAVIITCASQAYLGDPVDVGVAVRRAIPRLPRVMLAALARYVLLVVGLFVFLVGALYVIARYFALTEAIILEDAGVAGAFGRSSQLSKDRKWHILNTLGLVGIIYWIVAIGLSMFSAVLGNLVLQTIVGALITVLAYPVIAITECLLYYDARIQSEGLDIELLAGDLTAPAGSAAP